jgi:hypothetical protein
VEDEARTLDPDPACLQCGHPASLHLPTAHLCLAIAAHGRACACTELRLGGTTQPPEAGEPGATPRRGDA